MEKDKNINKQYFTFRKEENPSTSIRNEDKPPCPPEPTGEKSQFGKFATNPFVPLGMGATVLCLMGMMKNLQVNPMKTQYYMRGRIAAQFFTIMALVGGGAFASISQKKEQ